MRISICIPVFNMTDCIERCIQSALNQTDGDFEVVVIDNQSTDDTYEKAKTFNDGRLRVLRNEKNLGAYGNHNRCLETAKGDWVKFLHGDDELHPRCLAQLRNAISRCPREIALIGCGAVYHGQDDREFGKSDLPSGLYIMKPAPPSQFVLQGNIFGTPTMTLVDRKKLLDIGGFDVSMEPAADGDCWISLRKHYPSAVLPEHLVIVRDDPPGKFSKRAALSARFCAQIFRQIEKWHRLDAEASHLPLSETIYAEWLCRETFRFWNSALFHLLAANVSIFSVLWGNLGAHHMRSRSLLHYLGKLLAGRTSSQLRSRAWPEALSGLRMNPHPFKGVPA